MAEPGGSAAAGPGGGGRIGPPIDAKELILTRGPPSGGASAPPASATNAQPRSTELLQPKHPPAKGQDSSTPPPAAPPPPPLAKEEPYYRSATPSTPQRPSLLIGSTTVGAEPNYRQEKSYWVEGLSIAGRNGQGAEGPEDGLNCVCQTGMKPEALLLFSQV